VIEGPLNLPLDAELVNERARAKRVLEAAALIARQFKVKFTPHVVTARSAGRAIVEEAEQRRSEVIIMGTARKRRIADRAFGGRTTDYVVDHAPCEVLLDIVPKGYPSEGSAQLIGESAPPPSGGGGIGGDLPTGPSALRRDVDDSVVRCGRAGPGRAPGLVTRGFSGGIIAEGPGPCAGTSLAGLFEPALRGLAGSRQVDHRQPRR
jgi:hypothetical protein